jgi:hypothetical protein
VRFRQRMVDVSKLNLAPEQEPKGFQEGSKNALTSASRPQLIIKTRFITAADLMIQVAAAQALRQGGIKQARWKCQ